MPHLIYPQFQQIYISASFDSYRRTQTADLWPRGTEYALAQEALRANLLQRCAANVWPAGSCETSCPWPILVGKQHLQRLSELNEALTTAITDIVQRWWTDKEARFPERMPLEKSEEDLLQWLEGQVLQGNAPRYPVSRGSWRPDFLIEDYSDGDEALSLENYRITEINARFPFNGFMHVAYGQQALEDMGVGNNGLISATDPAEVIRGLFKLFQPDLPLHLLKGEEHGIDIHMFIDVAQRLFGVVPRLITPGELRLLPDPQSKGGYRLCCVVTNHAATFSSSGLTTCDGEVVEEIHQVGLELHQRELHALEPEMLRQISLRCFNDMRTILLVHDKRMLGIVKQELQALVTRQVLTPAQAQVLKRGITDTILPGSQELSELLQMSKDLPDARREYILKPVRSGKGAGIVFGEDCSPTDWTACLEGLRSAQLESGGTCVVQRRIMHRLYDVVLNASGDRVRYPLVGTYHVVHGQLLGLGIWRSSADRICAVSRGGSWFCSVVPQDARWLSDGNRETSQLRP